MTWVATMTCDSWIGRFKNTPEKIRLGACWVVESSIGWGSIG